VFAHSVARSSPFAAALLLVGCPAPTPSADAGFDTGGPDVPVDASPGTDAPDAGRDADPADAPAPSDAPTSRCGDARVEGTEACDDGVNDGSPGTCTADCSERVPEAAAFPVYRVVVEDRDGATHDGTFDVERCTPSPSPECAGMCIEDEVHCARITYLGGGEWQLDLRAKGSAERVPVLLFPADVDGAALGAPDDDVYYYPQLSGSAERFDHRTDLNETYAQTYPGGTFAPLVMLADPDDARLVHASNWPPIAVSPAYGGGRLTLWYQDAVSTPIGDGIYLNAWQPGLQSTPLPGETRSYRFTEVRVTPADVPPGHAAWHVAMDRYRDWLAAHTGPAPAYPEWMRESHGFIGVQLEFYGDGPTDPATPYSPTILEDFASDWGARFPWMLLWGQMSPYAGDCCDTLYEIHPRFGDLPGTVADLRATGLRVGFYSAPHWRRMARPEYRLGAEAGTAWLVDWMATNEGYGADAHYVDTIARVPWGQPAVVRELFAATGSCAALRAIGGSVAEACGVIPLESVIEGAVDVYPAAGLMDGGLAGYPGAGMADNTAPLSIDRPFVTFPELVYFLLDGHLLHLGGYNNDAPLAGTEDTDGDLIVEPSDETRRWYWAERQAFLLGARITGSDLEIWLPEGGVGPNPRLTALIAERDRVDFWARRPRYRDRIGLGPPPEGVDVRRFETEDGGTLLAVVNDAERRGLSITVDGVEVPLCPRRFALIDPAAPRCGP
jgi:hypothetical protein